MFKRALNLRAPTVVMPALLLLSLGKNNHYNVRMFLLGYVFGIRDVYKLIVVNY